MGLIFQDISQEEENKIILQCFQEDNRFGKKPARNTRKFLDVMKVVKEMVKDNELEKSEVEYWFGNASITLVGENISFQDKMMQQFKIIADNSDVVEIIGLDKSYIFQLDILIRNAYFYPGKEMHT